MTQQSVMLEKKLHQLESELADVFRIPLEQIPGPRHFMPFDDVRQRIQYLKKLHSAEVTSQPQNSDQLHEIAGRITAVEAAFHDWDESRNSAFNNFDDTHSICSDCTQTLLNIDAEAKHEPDSPASAMANFNCEETPGNCIKNIAESHGSVKEAEAGNFWRKFGQYCGVFSSGMIVGAVICVQKLSSGFDMAKGDGLLLPPT